MISFTLIHALAVILGLLVLTLLVSGLRCAFIDESAIGGVLLVVAWWLL